MSLQTKCSECGEWFAIGRNRAVGEPCHRCQQKKSKFAAEIAATYPEPKCAVFGCTIPRGIPHEHPAGVSAVMRDPAAPLDDAERYELNCLRAENRKHKEDMIHLASLTPPPMTFVVDDPMVPGRKLRDSLLMAGHNDQVNSAASNTGELITDDELAQWAYKLAGSFDQGEPRRLSVAQIVGRIATGIVLFIGNRRYRHPFGHECGGVVMSGEKIREEFEAWHKQQKNMLIRAGEPIAARSCESLKEIYFSAWKASRAAIEVELPQGFTYHGASDQTEYVLEAGAVVAAIEHLGLRVKP